MGRAQPFDQRDDRVAGILDAEDDLILRVVDRERRGERLLDVILDAGGGTENCDRRPPGGKHRSTHVRPYQEDRNGDEMG